MAFAIEVKEVGTQAQICLIHSYLFVQYIPINEKLLVLTAKDVRHGDCSQACFECGVQDSRQRKVTIPADVVLFFAEAKDRLQLFTRTIGINRAAAGGLAKSRVGHKAPSPKSSHGCPFKTPTISIVRSPVSSMRFGQPQETISAALINCQVTVASA
ncbi:hypothetical protein DBIPINDM_003627 [Mesorhizobium sp. AR02]|uniref:hypothetical protein n=1 Tax=Mesorhizobium sp. AR02 TaxID=2865837 RepID=UPI0021606759|nr:hypothetical protein [Mesorhizobium sp. AR02]UVK50463.1 hypothetical protein DBIPINDM_003627 [Mesorhizobium sp. AR02]